MNVESGAIAERRWAETGRARLHAVTEAITRAGGTAMAVAADLTRYHEIEAMRRRIEAEYGVVGILVANAGGSHTPPGAFEQVSEDGWRASIEGNLTAAFLTIKSFLPSMKARGSGSIITLSSSAGRRPTARSPVAYAAAEVGPSGIRVNCIAPETILTERNQGWIPKQQQESLAGMHPLRRLGTPEDIAGAALFLASEASSWITGLILDVTGGAVMI